MSSLLRPVGHLPPSVYWVRRALVVVVVLALVIILVRVIGGGGDPKNSAATDPGQNPAGGPTVAPTSTPTPGRTAGSGRTTKTSEPTKTPESPATPKDVKCSGDDVSIDVVPVSRTLASGNSLNLVIQLSAVRDECKAAVDPTELSLTITSGVDQIWSTEDCEKSIPRATLVLAKGKQSTATVAWNGRRSRPGCLPGQLQAKPGTYVVKAVYDGRASTAQAFTIV
ncbi:hypothetical protein [Kribbella sp. CA-293567]|uniref:hypothetical protein n=1 Tax=Kribbella sp. CA-293567 TaxID=3002436 RepID=UPI0022DDA61B|nr:hypothetical protein [Kribbella sp. CA-293567]WBQ06127.1 hypothetical protein OX958_04815 [Kribbella sp. CA-293567]